MVEEDRSQVVEGDGEFVDLGWIYGDLLSCGICSSFPCRRMSVPDYGHGCSVTTVLA
jgi:hypothetical protein